MKNIDIKDPLKKRAVANIIIYLASLVLIYLLAAIYFGSHFFFNTVINGVDVSLKSHNEAENMIRSNIRDYKLQLVERDGETEEITGKDVGLEYSGKDVISGISPSQNSFKWISTLIKPQKYNIDNLFVYNTDALENKINGLNCLNKAVTEPKDVSFKYSNGSFVAVEEVYGNKIIRDKLIEDIKLSILNGERKLNLNRNHCYENPRYTLDSPEVPQTRDLLNKYAKTKITYIFESEKEILDGNMINKWLDVDESLDVVINSSKVMEYIRGLSLKYDTVGATRKFKTSIGKTVEVKGGLYGWKINRAAEASALVQNIKRSEVLEKEPVYAQKALPRGGDEIGKTYVEINITRQRLWFYKEGRLVVQGSVVTGNPNNGNATKLGVHMLNYKEEGATLKGEDYEAEVTYWMPFYGNMGIHDASWRYSFGGDIYKTNGTHGCVNAPLYLAKKIYENIEPGTPIVCYEEEEDKDKNQP